MDNGFFFERGKFLFAEGNTDPFSSAERSKSVEHDSFERSKNYVCDNFEKTQKLKKTEENQS